MAGPEFGPEKVNVMLVVRSLYGLNFSEAALRALLAEQLHELGYKPSIDDPDVWMRLAVKPGGLMYYEYVICYVDDIMFISDDPLHIMKDIQDRFKIKGDKIGEPAIYPGEKLSKITNANGQGFWDMSSDKYFMAAVTNVEYVLEKWGLRFPSKYVTPMSCSYLPDMDVPGECK